MCKAVDMVVLWSAFTMQKVMSLTALTIFDALSVVVGIILFKMPNSEAMVLMQSVMFHPACRSLVLLVAKRWRSKDKEMEVQSSVITRDVTVP